MRYRRPAQGLRVGGGFTLIEIMVVVVVIAIVAAAVIPNLHGSAETSRLDSAAVRLADLLDYCKRSAVNSRQVYGLMISRDGQHYQLAAAEPVGPFSYLNQPSSPKSSGEQKKEKPDDQPEAMGQLHPVKMPGFAVDHLPQGVKITDAEFFELEMADASEKEIRILFFPDGTSEFASLTLGDSRGDRRQVDLNGLSGNIDISTPKPSKGENSDQQS